MSDKDEEPLDETHPMDLLAEKGTIPFSSIMEYEPWDSTCEMCKFHYYNPYGDGPMSASDKHGSNGWKTIDELEDDLRQGPNFQFLIGAYIEMRHRGYEVICGDCVDELLDDEEE